MAGAITAKYRDTLIHVYRVRSWMQKIDYHYWLALIFSEGVLTNYDITNNFFMPKNVLAMAVAVF